MRLVVALWVTLTVLTVQVKTLHIPADTIPPSLLQTSRLSSSSVFINIHHLTQSASSLHSIRPNHRNLPILVDKLTGSRPSSFLLFILSFLSLKLKPRICLEVNISLHTYLLQICT